MNLRPQVSPTGSRPYSFRTRVSLLACLRAVVFLAVAIVPLRFANAQQSATGSASGSRPNIILIMADDMGWSDIGCYGGEIDTPNIDRLAAEGMRFTQFYNNAKCTTTRASLLTGLYPRKGGKGSELLDPNMLTLGEAMKLAGYQTGMSGKWHNGSKAPHRPFDRGFDESYGLWDGCCNFFYPTQPDPKFKGGRVRPFGRNDEMITEFPDDYYTTDAFTDHAIETIKAQAAKGEPFFHYLAYTAPHYPLHALPEDIAKYKDRYKEGWEKLRQRRHQRQIEYGLVDPLWKMDPLDDKAEPWDEAKTLDENWQNLRMEVYAAMIDRMDQNIGRLLTALEEIGTTENTLILFLSDNGGCSETPGGNDPAQVPGPREFYSHVGPGWASASNTPFRRYKSYCHEGGVSTPLVVRWPAVIQPENITNQVGHIIDFLPTFLDAAGAAYPTEYNGNQIIPAEGKSLLPIFQGEEREPHEDIFWHWAGTRGVRHGNWKLDWDKGAKAWELYDLAADRTEMNNLAAEHPDLVAELGKKWEDWAALTGVKY